MANADREQLLRKEAMLSLSMSSGDASAQWLFFEPCAHAESGPRAQTRGGNGFAAQQALNEKKGDPQLASECLSACPATPACPQNPWRYMAEVRIKRRPCETDAAPAFPSHGCGPCLHIMASRRIMHLHRLRDSIPYRVRLETA
jgi:hypothetical protein